MGLTIHHYDLKSDATSPRKARQLVEQLRQAALDLAMSEVGQLVEFSGTACHFQNAQDESLRWLLVQARRLIRVGRVYYFAVPTWKDQLGGDFAPPIAECRNFEHLEADGRTRT